MAYVSKEKKAKIAAALKGVMPKNWKYSLRVDNHTQIVMTIMSAPVDLIAMAQQTTTHRSNKHIQLNCFTVDKTFTDPSVSEIMSKARDALNLDNFDKSDSQVDYFHVGHYVAMHLGRWDKPFTVTTK